MKAIRNLLAACRRRGIDHLVLAAALVGGLLGPSAASSIAAVLRQATICTAASAVLPTNTNKETA